MGEDNFIPLSYLPEGCKGVITNINGGRGLVRRLLELGLVPGTTVSVIKSWGPGPLLISVRGYRLALGHGVARKIIVKVISHGY